MIRVREKQPAGCATLLEELVDERRLNLTAPVAIVVAHPDDEVIGMGAQLHRLQNVTVIHVTDGSPHDLRDANDSGFPNAQAYARARRAELKAALEIAGIPLSSTRELRVPDQEAPLHLVQIVRALQSIFNQSKPQAVFTHPYEGGHPDHDATALAVHTACALLPRPPLIHEMTSYYGANGSIVTGEFLPEPTHKIWTAELSREEVQSKERMFGCFKTQARVLQAFSLRSERFRTAPRYDFTQPPHPGALYYEQHSFGMPGFCAWAQTALLQLGIEVPL
ncbi:MAG: PIG-L family deacetylase [Verrucomicrobia bacterium]|nr:PIG-L family deacetylase [Verrucomicrobiota bacterium]